MAIWEIVVVMLVMERRIVERSGERFMAVVP